MNDIKKRTANGCFRMKRGFTIASNAAIRDMTLSLKAKGLYILIRSFITLIEADPSFVLTKTFLIAHCLEKERAFNSAWDELKSRGYLKVYINPKGENNSWFVEYDLLDEADLDGGVHTYYFNQAGELTNTNLTRLENRKEKEAAVSQVMTHTPQNVPNGSNEQKILPDTHTLQNVPNGPHTLQNRTNGKRTYANEGHINKTTDKTNNKTNIYNSFTHSDDDGMSEEERYDVVVEELETHQAIPYQYAQEPSKMACAIKYLTEYEARCNSPFVTATGAVDGFRMDAFKFCVECLIEMACDSKLANYRGAMISYAKVIDQINKNSSNCAEGGLYEFMEQTIDDLLHAYHTTKITDIRKYTKSLIWSSFATYKVKLDAFCCV